MTYSSVIKKDYKSVLEPERGLRRRLHPLHWLVLGAVAVSGIFLYTSAPERASANLESAPPETPGIDAEQALNSLYKQEIIALPGQTGTVPAAASTEPDGAPGSARGAPARPEAVTGAVPQASAPSEPAAEVRSAGVQAPTELPWREVTVTPGDSLARIFSRLDLSPRSLHEIIHLSEETRRLTRIHPGEKLQVRIDADQGIQALRYEYDRMHALLVTRTDDEAGFEAREVVREPQRAQVTAAAEIDSSLFLAGQQAGLSDNLIMELAGIFGWDIDFALDIRKGDRFSVLYEELFLEGDKIGTGEILAAEFVNQGRTYRAVRYTTAEGRSDYYAPDGRSMRKAFLRTPVAFSRISSRFNLKRKHPVLNRIRAHKGVDYAAPYGTPIKATGSGKVVFQGTKGGYGRTVILQHGTRYSTLYAHMSRHARGLKTGSRVQQGQVIGYIGKSGLATGPHLHYEFRIDGVHRNPLTVDLPAAEPIEARYREDFESTATQLLAELELAVPGSASQVAMNRQE
ncbi:MAG TPA: peptidoglycan DD-metalloendopeptidase family protein [Thiohalobacter sp.]|nr:peptidoglycan DD-metalloendopeptidase family protein [Thiohalobacter sp.]